MRVPACAWNLNNTAWYPACSVLFAGSPTFSSIAGQPCLLKGASVRAGPADTADGELSSASALQHLQMSIDWFIPFDPICTIQPVSVKACRPWPHHTSQAELDHVSFVCMFSTSNIPMLEISAVKRFCHLGSTVLGLAKADLLCIMVTTRAWEHLVLDNSISYPRPCIFQQKSAGILDIDHHEAGCYRAPSR